MEIGTIIGFVFGVICIGLSMFLAADSDLAKVATFWNLESVLITIGGTIAATKKLFRREDLYPLFLC